MGRSSPTSSDPVPARTVDQLQGAGQFRHVDGDVGQVQGLAQFLVLELQERAPAQIVAVDDVHGPEEIGLAPHYLLLAKLEVHAIGDVERDVQLAQLGGIVVVQQQVVGGAAAVAEQPGIGVHRITRHEGATIGIRGHAETAQRRWQGERGPTEGSGGHQRWNGLRRILQTALVAGAGLARNAADAGNLERPEIGRGLQLAAVADHRELALTAELVADEGRRIAARRALGLELVVVLQIDRQVLADIARVLELHRGRLARRQDRRPQQGHHAGG